MHSETKDIASLPKNEEKQNGTLGSEIPKTQSLFDSILTMISPLSQKKTSSDTEEKKDGKATEGIGVTIFETPPRPSQLGSDSATLIPAPDSKELSPNAEEKKDVTLGSETPKTKIEAYKDEIAKQVQELDGTKKNALNIIKIIDNVLVKNFWEYASEAFSPTKTNYSDIDILKNICIILSSPFNINAFLSPELYYKLDKNFLNQIIDKLKEDFFCFTEAFKTAINHEVIDLLLANNYLDIQLKNSRSKKIEIKIWKYIITRILENNTRTFSIIAINVIKKFGLKNIFKLKLTDILESLPSILTTEAIEKLNTDVTFDDDQIKEYLTSFSITKLREGLNTDATFDDDQIIQDFIERNKYDKTRLTFYKKEKTHDLYEIVIFLGPTLNQKLTMEMFLSDKLIDNLNLIKSENVADRPQEIIIRLIKEGPTEDIINAVIELIATNRFLRNSLIDCNAKKEFASLTADLVAGSIKNQYLKLFGGKKNVSTIISTLLINLTPSLTDENKIHAKNAMQFIVGNSNNMHLFCKSVLAICHNVPDVRNSTDLVSAIATCTNSYLTEKYKEKEIPSLYLTELLFTEIIPHNGNSQVNLITGRAIDALFRDANIDYWGLISNVAELMIKHPSLANKLKDENKTAIEHIKPLMTHYMIQEGQEKIKEIATIIFKMIDRYEKRENSNALISFLKPLFISLDEETDNLVTTIIHYYIKKHEIPYVASLTKEEIKEIRANIYHATINHTSDDLKNIIFDGTKEGFTLTEEILEIIKDVVPPLLASKIISRLEPTYSGFISESDLAEFYSTPQSLNNSQSIFSKIKYNLIRIKLKSLIPALVMGMVTYTILYVFTKYSLTFLMASGISMSLATCPLFLFVSPIYKNTKIKDIAKLKGISISLALIAIFSILAIIASNSFAFNPLPYVTICCIAICCLLLNKTHTNNLIRLKRNKQSPMTSAQLNSLKTKVDKNSVIRDNTKSIKLTEDKTCTAH